jgi:citrate lyase subunit gamma (acyl carrier protein)
MKIAKESIAGTLESNDLLVRVSPGAGEGVELVVNSEVIHQFGPQIEAAVRDVLGRLGIERGTVVIEDKGALDCTIRARVEAAVMRACETGPREIEWSKL